jgi:hypothetical protein
MNFMLIMKNEQAGPAVARPTPAARALPPLALRACAFPRAVSGD